MGMGLEVGCSFRGGRDRLPRVVRRSTIGLVMAVVAIAASACSVGSSSIEPVADAVGPESESTTAVPVAAEEDGATESEAGAEQLELMRGYDDLRYAIDGTVGRVKVTWTGRLGGSFTEQMTLSEGSREIAVGPTVDGVLPSIAVDGGEKDLAVLDVAIFDGSEELHRCGATDQVRRSLRCADGRLRHRSDPVDVAVGVSRAAELSVTLTDGHRTRSEVLVLAEPGVVQFASSPMTSVFATAWNEGSQKVTVTIDIDGERAASGDTSAGVSLVAAP